MTVSRDQRHTRHHPCPRCGGHEQTRRGQGERCFGFTTEQYVYCTREEYAGDAPFIESAGAWRHRLGDPAPAPKATELVPGVSRRHRRARRDGEDPGRLVATYDYRDRDGRLVYQVRRYVDQEGHKTFRQYRSDPTHPSGWRAGLEGAQRVLYRLTELHAADPTATVFIPEGEKDVDGLRLLGLVATCNSEGAGRWLPEFADELRGRHVVILPDNDPEGDRHGEQVAHTLAGVAASVKALALPRLPHAGDVSDWLAAGGTRDHLEDLATVAPQWQPEGAPSGQNVASGEDAPGRVAELEREVARERAARVRAVRVARTAQRERNEYRRRCTFFEASHQRIMRALAVEHAPPLERILAVKLSLEYENRAAAGELGPEGRLKVVYDEPEPTTPQEERKAGYSLAKKAGCTGRSVSRAMEALVKKSVIDRYVDDPVLRNGGWARDAWVLRPPKAGHPGLELLDDFIRWQPSAEEVAEEQARQERRPATTTTAAIVPRCLAHPDAEIVHSCGTCGQELGRTLPPPVPVPVAPIPTGHFVAPKSNGSTNGHFVASDEDPHALPRVVWYRNGVPVGRAAGGDA
jgi:hypothetical protein